MIYQEQIKAIEDYMDASLGANGEITKKAEEAVREMKAASSDLISRQAAIDGKISITRNNGLEIYSDEAVPVEYLQTLPSAEPEIVMCKECKHRGEKPIADGRYWCDIHGTFMYYCSDAERKIDGGLNQQTGSA